MVHVILHVYDLANGLGNGIEIWHSAIYVYEREFEFGPRGIVMRPKEVFKDDQYEEFLLGETNVDLGTLMSYLFFLSKTEFSKEKYNLFSYNCNVFANFLSNNLVGTSIPKYLLCTPGTVTRVIISKLLDVLLLILQRRAYAVSEK